MATIIVNRKDGKIVSYKFRAYLGRDSEGKQIARYVTWTPPANLTQGRIKKAAEQAAAIWEHDVREEYRKEQEAAKIKGYNVPPDMRRDDLVSFINDVWLPLHIRNGDRKQPTIVYYEDIAQYIVKYFRGSILQDISPVQIQRYLQNLRNEHKLKTGRELSSKIVRRRVQRAICIFLVGASMGEAYQVSFSSRGRVETAIIVKFCTFFKT